MQRKRQVDEDEDEDEDEEPADMGIAMGPKGRRALKQARTRIRTTELQMDDEDDALAAQPKLDPSVWKPQADEVPSWVAPSSLVKGDGTNGVNGENGANGDAQAAKEPQEMKHKRAQGAA